MGEAFFGEVTEPIRYEGLDSTNPLAFKVYDPDRIVLGQRMEDHLRTRRLLLALVRLARARTCSASARSTGPGWRAAADPMAAARTKMAVAFEFFSKLGIPYYCFHDRDVAPGGRRRFAEFRANLDALVDDAAGYQEQTGVRLLWGTANLFTHPRYQAGAATNPDPEVFAYAAAQVKHMLEVTQRLGGAELRPVGRPRGLRHAAQHRPAPRGGAARALPAPRRRAQAQDRLRRASC